MGRLISRRGSRRAAIARRTTLVAAVLLGISSAARAMFMLPIGVPIDRVITNVEARLAEDPADVDALYTLARAHYLAFINKSSVIPAFRLVRNDKERIETPPQWMTEAAVSDRVAGYLVRARATELVFEELGYDSWLDVPQERVREVRETISERGQVLREQGWQPKPLPLEQVLAHVREARDAFQAAIERSPENGLYRLGLASLYEQFARFRETVEPLEGPALRAMRIELALEAYYEAYERAIDADRSREDLPVAGLRDLVGYEAGTRYLELAEQLAPDPTAEERRRRERVRADLGVLQRLPQRSITPVVLSLRPVDGLASLIDPEGRVYFDLDGDDLAESWTWVRPETGILTWDPHRTGEITSGRQLFGNATWWLLFRDGYRALDTLDDDRDGYVSGAELDGLALWFDRNSDGRSDPGEVVPIEYLPVRALGARPDGRELGGLRHSRGLVLADGQVLPTYDWIARRAGCETLCADAGPGRR